MSEVNLSDPKNKGKVPNPDDYNKSGDGGTFGFEIHGGDATKGQDDYLDAEDGRT